MKFLRSIALITTLITLVGQLTYAQNDSVNDTPVDTITIESSEPNAPVQKIESGYFEVTQENAQEIIAKTIETNKHSSVELLISTDSPEIFENTELAILKNKSLALGILAAPELADQTADTKQSWLKRSAGYVKDSVKRDPIGIAITTVIVGMDTFMWIHASQYSKVTMAGNILTNLIVNFGFALRKNAWGEISSTLATKAVVPILKSVGLKNFNSTRAQLMTKMISNFTMVLTVQAVRMGFIVLGGSGPVLMGGNNYSFTDITVKAGVTAFLVATAFTFNGFGWDNWIARFDRTLDKFAGPAPERFAKLTQRQRIAEMTKFLAYRFYEGRALLAGKNITSAALMSPNVYGYMSWVWVAGHGTIGLAAFLTNKINIRMVFVAGKKFVGISDRFSEKIVSFKKLFGSSAISCTSAFAF